MCRVNTTTHCRPSVEPLENEVEVKMRVRATPCHGGCTSWEFCQGRWALSHRTVFSVFFVLAIELPDDLLLLLSPRTVDAEVLTAASDPCLLLLATHGGVDHRECFTGS